MRRDFAIAALLPIASLMVLWPALSADLYADDYFFIALARRAASPVDYFTTEHFFGGYLYRPIPMAIWWFFEHYAGGAYPQYVCNALLLGTSGASLYWVLRELAWTRSWALAMALLYVWLPANISTSLWLADRFDLAAVTCMLAAIALWLRFVRAGGAAAASGVLALFAVTALSKELSYLVPLVLGLALVANWNERNRGFAKAGLRAHISLIAGCGVLLVAILLWRAHIGIALAPPSTAGNGLLTTMLYGTVKWWRFLPAALVFTRAPAADMSPWLSVLLATGCLAVAIIGWRASGGGSNEGFQRRLGISLGVAILLLTPVVQAPHLTVVDIAFAAQDGVMGGMFVERFYFFGWTGLLLAVGNGIAAVAPQRDAAVRRKLAAAAMSVCVLSAAWCLVRDSTITAGWPRKTNQTVRVADAAVESALGRLPDGEMPCTLRFLNSGDGLFQAAGEAMIKVIAARPEVDRCIIETEGPPMFTLTDSSAFARYTLEEAGATLKVVRFAGWIIIPGVLVRRIDPAHTRVYAFDPATGKFNVIDPPGAK